MGNGPSRSDPSGYADGPSDDQPDSDTTQTDIRHPPSTETGTSDTSTNIEPDDSSVDEDDAAEDGKDTVGSAGSVAGSAIQTQKPDADQEAHDRDENERGEADEQDKTSPDDLEIEITVYTDPWDAVGWGNEPGLRYLEEKFGDRLTVFYAVLRPRVIEEWEHDERMPIAPDVAVPDSTATSSRALLAARKQRRFREYLRRLHIAALSEGKDVENDSVLLELAEEIGLDSDQLREDMASVNLNEPKPTTVPRTEATIFDAPHQWAGKIEGSRIFARIVGSGVEEEPHGSSIEQFVDEHELVATAEVVEGLGIDESQAVDELHRNKRIVSRTLGVGTFWST